MITHVIRAECGESLVVTYLYTYNNDQQPWRPRGGQHIYALNRSLGDSLVQLSDFYLSYLLEVLATIIFVMGIVFARKM